MQTFRKLPITVPKIKKKAMTTSRLCHRTAGTSTDAGKCVPDA
jgi:hypothetical protein